MIEGDVRFIESELYPYGNKLPLINESRNNSLPAYTSGFRSIIGLTKRGRWMKSKGIGIISGNYKHISAGKNILTYYLSDVDIGSGSLIWGFNKVEEAENELNQIVKAKELGCPAPSPIGLGLYKGVRVLDFKDRAELFKTLATKPMHVLLEQFKVLGRDIEAACIFMEQPTDVRVDEILYGFLHPIMTVLIDARDCKDFLMWVGYGCGANLRKHHDAGLIHGTSPKVGRLYDEFSFSKPSGGREWHLHS